MLTPSSARSPICDWEVEEATRLNKRILPVVCRPLVGVSPPPRLRELNYIFSYEEPKDPGSGFGNGLARLIVALNTDFKSRAIKPEPISSTFAGCLLPL